MSNCNSHQIGRLAKEGRIVPAVVQVLFVCEMFIHWLRIYGDVWGLGFPRETARVPFYTFGVGFVAYSGKEDVPRCCICFSGVSVSTR